MNKEEFTNTITTHPLLTEAHKVIMQVARLAVDVESERQRACDWEDQCKHAEAEVERLRGLLVEAWDMFDAIAEGEADTDDLINLNKRIHKEIGD